MKQDTLKRDTAEFEVARWLEDSGRRRAISLAESPEEVLATVEKHAGTCLRTSEDVTAYFESVRLREVERARSYKSRQTLRECILLALLTASAAHYYYWDVSLQIASFQKVYYFVPASPARQSASATPATT